MHWIAEKRDGEETSQLIETQKTIIHLLVNKGVNINKKDDAGFTPIYLLCENTLGSGNADILFTPNFRSDMSR